MPEYVKPLSFVLKQKKSGQEQGQSSALLTRKGILECEVLGTADGGRLLLGIRDRTGFLGHAGDGA